MKMFAVPAALALLALCGCDPECERTVYREEFDRLGDHVACFNPCASVSEWPASLKYLSLNPKGDGADARKGFFRIDPAVAADRATLRFAFRFASDANRAFTLKLYFGDPEKPEIRTVTVDERGSFFGDGPAPEKPADGVKGFLPNWAMNKGVLTFDAAEDVAKLHLYRGGRRVVDATGALPKKPLVGWNVSAACNVEFDYVRVDANTTRPWLVGDPDEWLEDAPLAERPSDPIKLKLADGAERAVTFAWSNRRESLPVRVWNDAKKAFVAKNESCVITNADVTVSWPGGRVAVHRAPLTSYRYEVSEKTQILAALVDRGALPRVTPKVDLHVSPNCPTNYEVWVDGSYAGCMVVPSPVVEPKIGARSGSELGVDLRYDQPFALARCRENMGTFALECNGYLQREPWDGMPSSPLRSVPVASYVRCRALCTLDDTMPADFLSEITARVTYYQPGCGRSQAICEATARVDESMRCGATESGEPLYAVDFDFNPGEIQDLVSMLKIPYLELDFVGPLFEKDDYYISRKRSPSYERQSRVKVLSARLERAPVAMTVRPNRRNSTYYPNEPAGATVVVAPRADAPNAAWRVDCRVADANGKEVQRETLEGTGAAEKTIAFAPKAFGHYDVSYVLVPKADETFGKIVHDASFALLPPDTRKATKADSPYYCWNFNGAHGTPSKVEDWGDILQREGIRRTLIGPAETNAVMAAWGFTKSEFPFLTPTAKKGQTPAEAEEDLVKKMRDLRAQYPSCKSALIFHESGNGPFPLELVGGKTPISPEQARRDTNRMEQAVRTARCWRKADPSVRLIYGNSGFAVGLVAQLFRAGIPKDLVDALGDESVGMSQPPERCVAYPAWCLKRLAEIYGYDNAQPDAPWEWKSRIRRHFSERQCAAFHMRDALVAHAWRYTCIPLAGITEMANSYYDTIWGDSCCTRYPLVYPLQTFSAAATLTRVLDRAKFTRQLDTGSLTVYALEFALPDGSCATALWTARGEVDVTVDGAATKTVAMLGAETPFAGGKLVVDDTPTYVLSSAPLKDVKAALQRRYPNEPAPTNAVVAQPLASASEVVLDNAKDPRHDTEIRNTPYYSFHRPGDFTVFEAEEDGKRCLELVRQEPKTPCPELMDEYVMLKFPNAQPVLGERHTIGVWVKGNSSWGKIRFELTDAEGETWLAAGTGGYGDVVFDWPERLSLNFDGWHYLSFPITEKSPVKIHCPGDNEWQWQRDGEKGNGKIDFPVKVSGLVVSTYPQALDLVKMRKTAPAIRLRDVCLE